jgi:hypothetical protein
MPPDNWEDDPLLARLNALRKSPTPASPAESRLQSSSPSAADDLELRFRRLGTPKRDDLDFSSETESKAKDGEDVIKGAQEEDVDIEALLKDINVNERFARQEVESSKPMMDEAERLLQEQRNSEAKDHEDDKEESEAGDAKDEAEIIDGAMDEAEFEKHSRDPDDPANKSGNTSEPENHDEEDDDSGGLNDLISLPSVPNAAPVQPRVASNDTDEDDLAARLAALTLPTTLKPNRSSTDKSTDPKLPDIPDEEIESWCIICCDDAVLKCLGCDGDLYCTECWKEGHLSPEAGLEERKHKALAYTKPTGKKKQQRRVAA